MEKKSINEIKDELSRKYAENRVNERNEYPACDLHRRMTLTRFDVYDLEEAHDRGFVEGLRHQPEIWHNASEEMPNFNDDIVVADHNNKIVGFGHYNDSDFYTAPYAHLRLYLSSTSKWALQKDLFMPKPEEKDEVQGK